MAPYVVIVSLNNIFVYRMGFFKISNEVILMFTSAFICFFLGSLTFKTGRIKNVWCDSYKLLRHYNINRIKYYLYFVGITGILKALILYNQGAFLKEYDESEGIMGNGLTAHLLLSSYSVLPIYFLYWTYTKKVKELLPIILVLLVAFLSLVKYNIIGPIITLFIFVSLYRTELLKKASIVMTSMVVAIFILNYAIGFAISGSEVDSSFYMGHLWKYISGSLIFDNYIFTSGVRVGTDIFYKLLSFLFALPNMFIEKLFDINLFTHVGQEMRDVSVLGEGSNVVDAIGYLYPSKGDSYEIILFSIVIYFIGLTNSFIYKTTMRSKKHFSTFIANYLTYFVFLSFFAPFYVLSNPWEILVYSLFLPQLFLIKKVDKLC